MFTLFTDAVLEEYPLLKWFKEHFFAICITLLALALAGYMAWNYRDMQAQVVSLSAQVSKSQVTITNLKSQLKDKDAEITRLQKDIHILQLSTEITNGSESVIDANNKKADDKHKTRRKHVHDKVDQIQHDAHKTDAQKAEEISFVYATDLKLGWCSEFNSEAPASCFGYTDSATKKDSLQLKETKTLDSATTVEAPKTDASPQPDTTQPIDTTATPAVEGDTK